MEREELMDAWYSSPDFLPPGWTSDGWQSYLDSDEGVDPEIRWEIPPTDHR